MFGIYHGYYSDIHTFNDGFRCCDDNGAISNSNTVIVDPFILKICWDAVTIMELLVIVLHVLKPP